MNNNTTTAKNILLENNYTCVLFYNEIDYHSTMRGVKPLLEFLDFDCDFTEFSAADKVVGAGAAHLYVLLKVKELWAGIISEDAMKILQKNGISVFYDSLAPYIINRAGNGVCPIESAVKGIADSNLALNAIKETLKKL